MILENVNERTKEVNKELIRLNQQMEQEQSQTKRTETKKKGANLSKKIHKQTNFAPDAEVTKITELLTTEQFISNQTKTSYTSFSHVWVCKRSIP